MQRTTIIVASILALGAITLKIADLSIIENLGLFGTLALFSGCYLRGPLRWCFPIAAMVVSDLVGHFVNSTELGLYASQAMLLNYVGLAAMGIITYSIRNRRNFWTLGTTALAGSVAFFLLSNFGAWLDPRMGYERSISGLVQCYVAGIPFARGTFISDLIAGFGCMWLFHLYLRSAYDSRSMPVTVAARS